MKLSVSKGIYLILCIYRFDLKIVKRMNRECLTTETPRRDIKIGAETAMQQYTKVYVSKFA